MTTIRGYSPDASDLWSLYQLDPTLLAQLNGIGTGSPQPQLPFDSFDPIQGAGGLRAPLFDGGDSIGALFASPWANDAAMFNGIPQDPGRDLGAIDELSQLTGLPRDQVEQQLKDLFQKLHEMGMPIEGRPGSKAAQALADGDFSQLSMSELLQLLIDMIQQGQNPLNPNQIGGRPNSPLAPTGSWGNNGNAAGGGYQQTGANGGVTTSGPDKAPGIVPQGNSTGDRLASAARQVAQSMNSTGWCYKGVAQAVQAATGVQLSGEHAYQGADQLAKSGKFHEISVSRDQLKQLPPGAVVVWGDYGNGHGHISVALGGGQEASDHIQGQITTLGSNYRVFIPNN